jgi:hypothetical protein
MMAVVHELGLVPKEERVARSRLSLPPLGVRLFVLRKGVVLDMNATIADVAAAAPSSDAWACFEATGAGVVGLRRRREPRGWLTLREASVLIGCDVSEARMRLRALDEVEAEELGTAVRGMGRWELVSASSLRRYVARFGGAVSESDYLAAIDTEHVRRDVETSTAAHTQPRWLFSDGTEAYLGGHIEGASVFARELWAALQDPPVGVTLGPEPNGGREVDLNDLALFDLWLRQEAAKPVRSELKLELIERPADIPALPEMRWSRPPAGTA